MKIASYLFGILAFWLFFTEGCMTFRKSDQRAGREMNKQGIRPVFGFYEAGKKSMHFVKTGREDGTNIIFVHGSPGSWTAFETFIRDSALLQHYCMYSIDRLGFGYSGTFGRGETSLDSQSIQMKPLLEIARKNGKKVMLAGHSLGGPMVAKLAMDYPGLVDGIIIIAGSVDPALEPPAGWRHVMMKNGFRWLLPRSFRASNDEIATLRPELEKLKPQWKKVMCPVVVIHGDKDGFVPVGNADYIKNMLPHNAPDMRIFKGYNHFLVWTKKEEVIKAIFDLEGKMN